MARRHEIMKSAVGIDYEKFETGAIAFDYEGMMDEVGYTLEEVHAIQDETNVGRTPLVELRNITEVVRRIADPGKGARILVKDEAANPSGSFKDRRASVSVYRAKTKGYQGVIAATSGNYGAAVASQAAKRGIKCIIVQETYDSKGRGQPEIIEKGRACEAYGAEVHQLTVGPELFYVFLMLLEETGFFNASLYTPFSVAGIETLGYEVGTETLRLTGRFPDAVIVTHAGGGNVTGTARGLRKAGSRQTQVIAASVDITGLHMASDSDFNRKSFTTGHTGFGIPFATWPDRSDVPRNAARPLRYMDRYVTVTQGEVFYVTEMLAKLEGMERGPAGNTSLAAAIAIAREMDRDQVVVVQETEYTGAGKHPYAQLAFARDMGVEVRRGDPRENVPGKRIVIPEHPSQIRAQDVSLEEMRKSYIRNALSHAKARRVSEEDVRFLAEDTNSTVAFVEGTIHELEAEGVAAR
ncbi:MAG: 2-amino-4-oxopentanoate thiolase subunit OrtB [Firmicutes bacterium]|jgi:cysteine synthase|nr:2-amino-4-oxopentanoate thiolase subunit OrtB [Bacillota bacterium]MDH7495493.1 2-amino-4-oxopentanoate thiolase subunit OrtB [Bacillota bacterium]